MQKKKKKDAKQQKILTYYQPKQKVKWIWIDQETAEAMETAHKGIEKARINIFYMIKKLEKNMSIMEKEVKDNFKRHK